MDAPRILDGHVHIYTDCALASMQAYREAAALEAICIAAIGCIRDGKAAEQNILALILKREDSRFYACGSLLYPQTPVEGVPQGRFDFRAQAQSLLDAGFDGIKLLETKPGCRKSLGIALSDARYDAFWQYLCEVRAPLLWHVADPETFWDDRAPGFAVEHGWVYTDGTFPTKEALYGEVLAVLDRNPGLRATFAHFFFLSDFEEEARALLEKYPDVWLDITPGIEMYENFAKTPDKWHDFFTQYQNRIVFGTDNTDRAEEAERVATVDHIRQFLSTKDAFTFWQSAVTGIGLAPEAVQAIMRDNFLRRMGPSPKPVEDAALAAYIDRWEDCIVPGPIYDYIMAYRKGL